MSDVEPNRRWNTPPTIRGRGADARLAIAADVERRRQNRQLQLGAPPERFAGDPVAFKPGGRVSSGPCRHCRRPNYRARTGSCGRRDCPGYIDLWLGDVRERITINLAHYGGDVYMTTVTAPSMPWDTSACDHDPGQKCSGRIGCRVEPGAAFQWNSTADSRFTGLHRAAYQRVYRQFGPGALRRLVLAPEPQRRGLIHWHIVLGASTGLERAAARAYIEALRAKAPANGFGFVDRNVRAVNAGRAASYVAKYLAKPSEAAAGLRELVMAGEAPRRAVHVDRRLTIETRCTARVLRTRRALYMAIGITVACTEVEGLYELTLTFGIEDCSPDVGSTLPLVPA
jgi:hypothetical protein